MIDAARLWWAERAQREQILLIIMAVFLLIVFLWLGITRPLFAGAEAARLRHEKAVIDEATVQIKARALKAALAAPSVALDGPLQTVITQSASDAGFTLSRVDPTGMDAVSVTLVSAKSPAFFAWLNKLNAQGIFAEQVSVRTNTDATIAADALLKAQVR